MRCPHCGFENPEGLKFCNECGTPLRLPCAQCGFANQPQAKFCGECGAALPPQARASTAPPLAPRLHAPLSYTPAYLTEKILQSKAALEGERKQVTVLFADMKGSMELLAARDPEEARQLLDPVLERMMAAVHRYEGTVNQVMGDGIMALFGAPLAHEDHAVRACYAALAMQDPVGRYGAALRQAQGLDVQIRVGLNSGEVVVRAIGNGTEVPWPLLQAIAELPEAALYGGLAHLQAAEFMYETPLFPEHVYTFKHALPHEVAYGSLLQERRRVLHARIVEALERLAPDRLAEQVERLAHHALRGEVWDKALHYCQQAGGKAMARSAHREAVASFEQALDALSRLPESRDMRERAVDLRLNLRQVFFALGEYGRLLAALCEADSLAAALDDHRRLGQVAAYMSQYFWATADQERALASGQRALAFAEALGDVALQAIANISLGQAYGAAGDHERAIECFGKSVACLEGELLRERLGLPYLPAVFSRMCLGIALAEELGMRPLQAHCHLGLGSLYLKMEQREQACTELSAAITLYRAMAMTFWLPQAEAALAEVEGR